MLNLNHPMDSKEANARIKINILLQEAERRMLDDMDGKASVLSEYHVKITGKNPHK